MIIGLAPGAVDFAARRLRAGFSVGQPEQLSKPPGLDAGIAGCGLKDPHRIRDNDVATDDPVSQRIAALQQSGNCFRERRQIFGTGETQVHQWTPATQPFELAIEFPGLSGADQELRSRRQMQVSFVRRCFHRILPEIRTLPEDRLFGVQGV